MSNSKVGKNGRNRKPLRRKQRTEPTRIRPSLVASIAAGTGLGAVIGLVTGYLLTPRSATNAARRPSDALSAWQEMARKLSEQLQAGGNRLNERAKGSER